MKHPDSPSRAEDRDAAAAHLEQYMTVLLREQPLQRAPATLAQRVAAAIEQRQRSAFQRWSLSVRIAFVVLAGMTAHLTFELMQLVGAGITAPRPPWLVVLAATAIDTMRQFPSVWSHIAFAVLLVVYGGIFGLSLAMYRTVHPRL